MDKKNSPLSLFIIQVCYALGLIVHSAIVITPLQSINSYIIQVLCEEPTATCTYMKKLQ